MFYSGIFILTGLFLLFKFINSLFESLSFASCQPPIRNVGRCRAYKLLQNGLSVAGVTYQFLFFGNKQVRDAKVWMKAELVKGFDANRVRADIARLSTERNIGKKMDRFHLFMSKGTPGSIYGENEIEIIEDIRAQDGKILTDGCSLILESEIKRSFPEYVASMLVRIGGAKTQMMSASKELLEKLGVDDIKKQKVSSNADYRVNDIHSVSTTARNLSPKVILNKSCLKFMTDTQKQLEKRDTYKYLRKNMLQTRKNVKPPTLNTHNSKTTHMFSKKKIGVSLTTGAIRKHGIAFFISH